MELIVLPVLRVLPIQVEYALQEAYTVMLKINWISGSNIWENIMLKKISEPVPIYQLLKPTEFKLPDRNRPFELPNKPSIAVLPFANISDNPEQE